jgi:hypothetical protein
VETIKTHIRRLLRKTGDRRLVDAARRLLFDIVLADAVRDDCHGLTSDKSKTLVWWLQERALHPAPLDSMTPEQKTKLRALLDKMYPTIGSPRRGVLTEHLRPASSSALMPASARRLKPSSSTAPAKQA